MKLSASESTPETPEGPGLQPWVFAFSAPLIYRDEPRAAQLTAVNGERSRSPDRGLHRVAAGSGDHRQHGMINHPMIFRRVVEAGQLRGFELRRAPAKYDCFDHLSGDLVPGDEYRRVHVDRRVWAPHRG